MQKFGAVCKFLEKEVNLKRRQRHAAVLAVRKLARSEFDAICRGRSYSVVTFFWDETELGQIVPPRRRWKPTYGLPNWPADAE